MAGRRIYDFESVLNELGWAYFKECKCGGVHKVYFKKGKFAELKVYPTKQRFEVKGGVQGKLSDMKTLLTNA